MLFKESLKIKEREREKKRHGKRSAPIPGGRRPQGGGDSLVQDLESPYFVGHCNVMVPREGQQFRKKKGKSVFMLWNAGKTRTGITTDDL